MIDSGFIIKHKIRDEILLLEKEHDIQLSKIQKILLTVEGPLSSVLDVLYGTVHLFMLDQHFENAKKHTAEMTDIDEGEEILYREVIVHKRGHPLMHITSCIPTSRCDDKILQDLLNEQLTTGTIIKNNDLETMQKITSISIEKTTPKLEDLFKTNADLLTRDYILTHNNEVILWTREQYPLIYFTI